MHPVSVKTSARPGRADLSPALLLLALAALSGCAGTGTGGPGGLPLYRCENDIQFTARFVDNTAVLDGTRGYDLLFRDAGGLTEKQPVYSNPRMRAEFGLGPTGREAILRYPLLPLVVRCVRE
jgi:hypothetical protein